MGELHFCPPKIFHCTAKGWLSSEMLCMCQVNSLCSRVSLVIQNGSQLALGISAKQ
jgi:hypothetical protein